MRRILITAGPTREPIDAVRYISNRSSGRMGIALAEAAAAAGHDVRLVLGPTALAPPPALRVARLETGDELAALLHRHRAEYDDLIMSAAVCDYRPRHRLSGKRQADKQVPWSLELEATVDLVAEAAQHRAAHQRVVAFALEEPENLQARAVAKLARKGADAIVANPLVTMDADEIEPVWITPDGDQSCPGRVSKADAAVWILAQLERLRGAAPG